MLKGINECFGCGLCASVCKQEAIRMVAGKEGFVYPEINNALCVNCGLCEKYCEEHVCQNEAGKMGAYAFQVKDDDIIYAATSGGIIPTLARHVIREGGAYFSTTYNLVEGAKWTVIDKEEDISHASGSKYFQIPLSTNTYSKLLNLLTEKHVLFVGTPCQVDAIKKKVPERLRRNLFLIDIICGGTPSEKLEKKYLEYTENTIRDRVVEHKFRSKKQGWCAEYLSIIKSEKGVEIQEKGGDNLFTRAYSSGNYMRESCYGCTYANRLRVGDLTVGDCWGISETKEIPNKTKGVSLVLLNTEKGKQYYEAIKETGYTSMVNGELLKKNKPLNVAGVRRGMRKVAYLLLNKVPFVLAVNIVCYRYLIKKIVKRGIK